MAVPKSFLRGVGAHVLITTAARKTHWDLVPENHVLLRQVVGLIIRSKSWLQKPTSNHQVTGIITLDQHPDQHHQHQHHQHQHQDLHPDQFLATTADMLIVPQTSQIASKSDVARLLVTSAS